MPRENSEKPRKTDKVQCTVQLTRDQLDRFAKLSRKNPLVGRASLIRQVFERGLDATELEAKTGS